MDVYDINNLKRENFGSGAPLEDSFGYSRMIKVGPYVEIGGTTTVQPDGTNYAPDDSNEQVRYILNKQLKLLEQVGASKEDVIRVNMFMTPEFHTHLKCGDHASAYTEIFGDIKPLSTGITINRLNRPGSLVEIQMAAIIGCGRK